MDRKRNRGTMGCLLAFMLLLAAYGTSGCQNAAEQKEEVADPVMDLLNQTSFFKTSPEELYFGEASQDTDSDQGVTIKYLASFFDGEATYLFFDLTDTGAGLFCEGSNGFDLSLDQYDFLEKTGYNDSRQYDLVSFDEKTQTATFCFEYIGPLQTDDLSFHIYSLIGNQKRIDTVIEDLSLYERLEKRVGEFEPENEFMGAGTSYGVFDEQTGESRQIEMPDFDEGDGSMVYRLKKDALSVPVTNTEGNHVADITNIGWRNGWLHVQINPENSIEWETHFNLKNNKTEELIYSPYNFSFGTAQDGEEQRDYYEYVFYAGELTEANLDCSIVFRNSAYRATRLKGDWELRLSIPDSLLKRLEADKAVPVDNWELLIQRAVISPVNVTLFASRKDIPEERTGRFRSLTSESLKLKLIYKDGKTADIPEESGSLLGNQKGEMFRFIHTAGDFENIAGLEVNGVLFPVVEQ